MTHSYKNEDVNFGNAGTLNLEIRPVSLRSMELLIALYSPLNLLNILKKYVLLPTLTEMKISCINM
jgi:hypothetical protein